MAKTFTSKPKADRVSEFISGSVDGKEPSRKLREKTVLKGFRIPESLDSDLKHLSVDLKKTSTELVIEALTDLIKKYYDK
jgi:hypothetical protein